MFYSLDGADFVLKPVQMFLQGRFISRLKHGLIPSFLRFTVHLPKNYKTQFLFLISIFMIFTNRCVLSSFQFVTVSAVLGPGVSFEIIFFCVSFTSLRWFCHLKTQTTEDDVCVFVFLHTRCRICLFC